MRACEVGHRATSTFDALHRVVTQTDADNNTTTSVYDAVDNRTVLVDPTATAPPASTTP
jgi:YD repeat-containing protein